MLFSFNESATTEIYTLSLHDALPISAPWRCTAWAWSRRPPCRRWARRSEEHTSELQSHSDLVCRLLLEKKNRVGPCVCRGARRTPLSVAHHLTQRGAVRGMGPRL